MTESHIRTLEDYDLFRRVVCETPVQLGTFEVLRLDSYPLPFKIQLEWGDMQPGSAAQDCRVLVSRI